MDELRYIYEHSDSAGIAVLQDVKLLKKLAKDAEAKGLGALGLRNDSFGPVKTVVLIHKGKNSDDEIKALGEANGVDVRVLSQLLDSTPPANYKELPIIEKSDLSTSKYSSQIASFCFLVYCSITHTRIDQLRSTHIRIKVVYTSGTTGQPKGVVRKLKCLSLHYISLFES